MARRSQQEQRGYLLPAVINPENWLSVCVPVPDDDNHRRAFLGQLDALASWWTWERDDAKQGTLAARVWRGIAECVRWRMENCNGCGERDYILRYNEDGNLEVSYDGGQTWQDGSQYDPRYNAPTYPPNGAVDTKCQAAANATAYLENSIDELSDWLAANSSLAGLVAVIIGILSVAGIIGTGGAATPAILALAAALLELGASGLAVIFTSEVYDTYRCILLCHLDDNGAISPFRFKDFLTAINNEFTGSLQTVLWNWTNNLGSVGLTNLGSISSGSVADCSGCDECEWCHDFYFDEYDDTWGWVGFIGYTAQSTDGVGLNYQDFVNTTGSEPLGVRGVYIRRDIAPTIVNRIEITYSIQKGTYNLPETMFGLTVNDTVVIDVSSTAETNGTDKLRVWTGNALTERVFVAVRSSRDASEPYSYSGSCSVRKIRMEGKGSCPFGDCYCD
jgi:hypothetical protein